jgi:hypothetical protein
MSNIYFVCVYSEGHMPSQPFCRITLLASLSHSLNGSEKRRSFESMALTRGHTAPERKISTTVTGLLRNVIPEQL